MCFKKNYADFFSTFQGEVLGKSRGSQLTFLHLRVLFDVCSAAYLAPYDNVFCAALMVWPPICHTILYHVYDQNFMGGSERCLKWGGQWGGTSI